LIELMVRRNNQTGGFLKGKPPIDGLAMGWEPQPREKEGKRLKIGKILNRKGRGKRLRRQGRTCKNGPRRKKDLKSRSKRKKSLEIGGSVKGKRTKNQGHRKKRGSVRMGKMRSQGYEKKQGKGGEKRTNQASEKLPKKKKLHKKKKSVGWGTARTKTAW